MCKRLSEKGRRYHRKLLSEDELRQTDAHLTQLLSLQSLPAVHPGLSGQPLIHEECRRLYGRLGDDTLCAVARWKMEGHTNAEIAVKLGCVPQTVERKLRTIRRLWAKRSRIDDQRHFPGRVLGFRAKCGVLL